LYVRAPLKCDDFTDIGPAKSIPTFVNALEGVILSLGSEPINCCANSALNLVHMVHLLTIFLATAFPFSIQNQIWTSMKHVIMYFS
jgi:hypothetical protein